MWSDPSHHRLTKRLSRILMISWAGDDMCSGQEVEDADGGRAGTMLPCVSHRCAGGHAAVHLWRVEGASSPAMCNAVPRPGGVPLTGVGVGPVCDIPQGDQFLNDLYMLDGAHGLRTGAQPRFLVVSLHPPATARASPEHLVRKFACQWDGSRILPTGFSTPCTSAVLQEG